MDQPETIISEKVTVNGSVTRLTLTSDGKLTWGQNCLVIEEQVLGFVADGPEIKVRTVVETGGILCCRGTQTLVRKNFVFRPMTVDSHALWCRMLRDYLDSLGRPKRLLVVVNPYGGKKVAKEVFRRHVRPLLDDAGIEMTVQETEYQLHAKKIASTLNVSEYDGIVCVSGDGILVEVVNGLLERIDWVTAIKIPIGVVPAGTGNGMAKSLLDAVGDPCKAIYATLAIIRGHKRTLDVATIRQKEITYFSVLMLAWGLVADIDIESEKYRWMGGARLDFYALARIFHLRQYNGCISFVPAPGFESYGEPTPCPSKYWKELDSSGPNDKESTIVRNNGYQGLDINFEDWSWRTIKGPFVSVWLHNVPWGAEKTMAAPNAKFSDGYLDLVIMRECSTLSLLSLMTGLSEGSHVKSPHVMYLKVKALILEPGSRVKEPEKGGIIDSDGEVLARGKGTFNCDQNNLMSYDKLEITVEQGLATLFTPI